MDKTEKMPRLSLPQNRIARYTLLTFLGLFSLIILLLTAFILWLNLADLRPIILSQIQKNTGLDVKIEGPLVVDLFPKIVIDAQNITVPAYKGESSLFTTSHLRLEANYGSFPMVWKGFSLQQFTLENPVINLVQFADGSANWQNPNAPQVEQTQPASADAKTFSFPISNLGQVAVNNMQLSYLNQASKQSVVAQKINFSVDARNLADTRALLNGLINNQAINGRLGVGLANSQGQLQGTLPLQAVLEAAGLNLNVNGQLATPSTTQKTGFKGTFSATSDNLKSSLDALLGKAPEGTPASPLDVAGQVDVSMQNAEGQVQLQQFKASLGTFLQAAGNISATWGATTTAAGDISAKGTNLKALGNLFGAGANLPAAGFSMQGQLSGADAIVFNGQASITNLLTAKANLTVKSEKNKSLALHGQINVAGASARNLGQQLGLAQPLPNAAFAVKTDIKQDNATDYTFSNLSATLTGLITATGQANVSLKNPQTPSLSASVKVNGPNTAKLGQQFGVAQPLPAKPFSVQADVSGAGSYSIKNLSASIQDVLTVKGALNVTPADVPEYSGNLAVNGSNIASAARQFGVQANGLPTSAFSVSSDINGKGAIQLPNLSINLPQLLQATGNVRVVMGTIPNIQATLNASQLNLNALGVCAEAPKVTQAQANNVATPPTTGAPWTTDPIDTSALRKVVFNIKADVKGINCARAPLTALSADVTNTVDQLNINSFAATIGQGSAQLKGTLAHSGTPRLNLSASTQNLAVEELVSTLKQRGVVLPINITANLTSSGGNQQQLVNNLSGTLKATADSGKIPYTNLLGNAVTIQRVIEDGIAGAKPMINDGTLNRLNASYTIRNGVLNTTELAMVTDNGNFKFNGTGTIDLVRWYINYTLTPAATGANDKSIAIPVLVKGSLSSPAIGADPSFISSYTTRYATKGIQKLLGDNVSGTDALSEAIGGALGGQGLDQQKLQEGVGNLLNNFIKK